MCVWGLHSPSRFHSFALISLIGIAIAAAIYYTHVAKRTYSYVHSFIHMYYIVNMYTHSWM